MSVKKIIAYPRKHPFLNKDTISTTSPNQKFQANGKLLLSGEYFVLDGTLALALPVKLGQSLIIENDHSSKKLYWRSFDHKGNCWFEGDFSLPYGKCLKSNDESTGLRLQDIFKSILQLNFQHFSSLQRGIHIQTHLGFPREWGLGTSSTLIYNLARWANVNPYALLEKTFGGSGYDIACAGSAFPILYRKLKNRPLVKTCHFQPPFYEQLYFLYLGRKQNSREGIKRYKSKIQRSSILIESVSSITKRIVSCIDFDVFEQLIQEHETLISKALELKKAKDLYFQDYWGGIKSLGAWGGDFVLITSAKPEKETRNYFHKKGFEVFFKYEELVLL